MQYLNIEATRCSSKSKEQTGALPPILDTGYSDRTADITLKYQLDKGHMGGLAFCLAKSLTSYLRLAIMLTRLFPFLGHSVGRWSPPQNRHLFGPTLHSWLLCPVLREAAMNP